MKKFIIAVLLTAFTLPLFAESNVTSTSLATLKNRLKSLTGDSNIVAMLSAEQSRQQDDDPVKKGKIALQISESVKGFHLTYRAETIALLAHEKKAKKNSKLTGEKVEQPTTVAMEFIQPVQLHSMLSKSQGLLDFIEQLHFVSEQSVDFHGQQAVLLSFNVAMETIVDNEKQRQHIDDFSGRYQIWITPSGKPIEAKLVYEGEGSYYYFFNFSVQQTISEHYQVVGNRLVVSEHRGSNKLNSTFVDHLYVNNQTITILSSEDKPVLTSVQQITPINIVAKSH